MPSFRPFSAPSTRVRGASAFPSRAHAACCFCLIHHVREWSPAVTVAPQHHSAITFAQNKTANAEHERLCVYRQYLLAQSCVTSQSAASVHCLLGSMHSRQQHFGPCAGSDGKAVTAAQVQEAMDQVQGAEHEDDFIQVIEATTACRHRPPAPPPPPPPRGWGGVPRSTTK